MERIANILEMARGLDLFGRHDALAQAIGAGDFDAALGVIDQSILDASEMVRPDRTQIRRSVHLRNCERLKILRDMVAELAAGAADKS